MILPLQQLEVNLIEQPYLFIINLSSLLLLPYYFELHEDVCMHPNVHHFDGRYCELPRQTRIADIGYRLLLQLPSTSHNI